AMASIYQGKTTLALWQSYQDGYQGFVPVTAKYIGNGNFVPIGSGGPPHHSNTGHDTHFAMINGANTGEAELAYVDPQNPGQSQQFTLSDCRVRAMLDTIAWSEGTSADADGGYGRVVKGTVTNSKHNPPNLIGQQNVTITDFSHHPDL